MDVMLKVKNLKKEFITETSFFAQAQTTQALKGVSFDIQKGETFGVVGESGCGKSTLARCVTRLIDVSAGSIEFQGEDITALKGKELQALRRRLQIVFQNSFSSLNPRMKLSALIEEPLIVHGLMASAKDRQDRVDQLLEMVGLQREMKHRYPREFSGGQRQRVGLARALAVEPEMIVCDEAVSSLDVSVQAQILNLLMDLQQKLGLTYLFIAHDLRVVEYIASRVAVMSEGQIVETAVTRELFLHPKHPYTQTLLSSIPQMPVLKV